DGRWRNSMRINTNRVHRKQSHLGTVTHQNKKESELQPEWIEAGCKLNKGLIRKISGTCLLCGDAEEKNSDERKRDGNRANKEIFPCGFNGVFCAVMIN